MLNWLDQVATAARACQCWDARCRRPTRNTQRVATAARACQCWDYQANKVLVNLAESQRRGSDVSVLGPRLLRNTDTRRERSQRRLGRVGVGTRLIIASDLVCRRVATARRACRCWDGN